MTKTDRQRVNDVFRALRRAGITARANFKCCMNCGLTALEDEYGLKEGDNFVFFHAQDAEVFDREGRLTRPLMVRHGGVIAPVAALAAFNAAGFNAWWDGDEARCVEVTL
jgi:hypothetical protein